MFGRFETQRVKLSATIPTGSDSRVSIDHDYFKRALARIVTHRTVIVVESGLLQRVMNLRHRPSLAARTCGIVLQHRLEPFAILAEFRPRLLGSDILVGLEIAAQHLAYRVARMIALPSNLSDALYMHPVVPQNLRYRFHDQHLFVTSCKCRICRKVYCRRQALNAPVRGILVKPVQQLVIQAPQGGQF